jgi:hypothetical protein
MQTLTVPKGHKKLLVRQCLNELSIETSFAQAKKWFMKNHKLKLADATFYHVRKDMQLEAANSVPAPKPSIRVQVHSIVDLVKTAKELVDKLGKDEVRKLIDLL